MIADRVKETTTTTGTGTLTLLGAVSGFRTFVDGFGGAGAPGVSYVIDGGAEWECGVGTSVIDGTFLRGTVLSSSNAGALVNFSAGTKTVFCSALAQDVPGNHGTAVLDFGATPGTNVVTVAVTNQNNITATSHVRVWMQGDSTATHNAVEHMVAPLRLTAADFVAGTGFTIYAVTDWRLTGTFTCHWSWQ